MNQSDTTAIGVPDLGSVANARTFSFRHAGLLVVAVAILVRAIGLFRWSLWEDEEATIYYAQHIGLPFPSFFPIFFLVLKGAFAIGGVSVATARVVGAVVGLASLWLVYVLFKPLVGRATTLLGVAFMAVSLGHVFWSQSVRYYTAALCFQTLSLVLFFRGFEKRRYALLVLANVTFLLALLCHFSSLLLLPVFVAYLLLVPIFTSGSKYSISSYLVFGAPLLTVTAAFGVRVQQSQALMGPWVLPSARDPWHVLVTTIAYFGPPLVAVAALASIRRLQMPRSRLLLACLAAVPVAEMVTITLLNVINVTWYYGLAALVGVSLLAAEWLVEMYEQNHQRLATVLASVVLVYSTGWLAVYFTTAAGDRPKWREATEYVAGTDVFRTSRDNSDVYATAPNVVAYYLGSPNGGRSGDVLVKRPEQTPPVVLNMDQWYLFPEFEITAEYQKWFALRCNHNAEFQAWLGPRDRTVHVYFCPKSATSSTPAAARLF